MASAIIDPIGYSLQRHLCLMALSLSVVANVIELGMALRLSPSIKRACSNLFRIAFMIFEISRARTAR